VSKPSTEIPALLLMPEYDGTLAAARSLQKMGVPVHVASSQPLAPALWSRGVKRRLRSPAFKRGPTHVLEWLLEHGTREPGAVLYPTSDEMAWLISRHKNALKDHYRLYSPGIETLRAVLDKRRLYMACAMIGIDVPRTWYPEDEAELTRITGASTHFLVKPRTQVFFKSQAKGGLTHSLADLKRVWQDYRRSSFAPELVADMEDITIPMVQEFIAVAKQGVHSISGFVNKEGKILATRGSCKLLQLPPSAGIGVCFESLEPDPKLVTAIATLCQRLGYFGVFEVEFLQSDDRHLLIDFNPRYYGQMEFDIARGMELPWLAHLSALDDEPAAINESQSMLPDQAHPQSYRNRLAVEWRLAVGGLGGAVSRDEIQHWRAWLRNNNGCSVDAFLNRSDPGPSLAAFASILWSSMRHPRGFWRSIRPSLKIE
jgi:predicted ATP-grasp superfamily ATP-dependent carboligase